MAVSKEFNDLFFPCECVSARQENYSDPWAGIAKNRLIVDGTKEQILNIVAREPRTISQLARQLDIAAPSVHAHISDMLTSELLRDSEVTEKLHSKERYYEPNFPVIWGKDRNEFQEICADMCDSVAAIFEAAKPRFEEAFNRTGLEQKGWTFADITQYLYACIQRGARQRLEDRGSLRAAGKHRNGVDWVFWAEEANGDAS